MSINKVLLSGNLTREPELKSTTNGTSILTFGIAVNDRRKNSQSGQWEDKPNFFECSMYGNRADSLSRYLRKGMKITLEGKLQWRQWEDKRTGENRTKVDIAVSEIEFMEQRHTASQPVQQPVQAQPAVTPVKTVHDASQPVQQPIPVQDAYYYDSDVPF